MTVVLSEDTVVVTLHGALSPAEKALAQSSAGANQIQEFHRQLFASSSAGLCQEIKRARIAIVGGRRAAGRPLLSNDSEQRPMRRDRRILQGVC